MTTNTQDTNTQAKKHLTLLSVVFALFGLILFFIWLFDWRFYETTDDCYVAGNKIVIQTQVDGAIKAYYAEDTDYVTEGQLLVELDPTQYRIEYETAKEKLALALRNVLSLWHDLKSQELLVHGRKLELEKATIDFECRSGLLHQGAVSKEEFYDYKLLKEIAQRTYEKTTQDYEAKKAIIDVPDLLKHPYIEDAKDTLKKAYLNLMRCKIFSPTSGFVAKRSCQVGQSVETNSTLMAVIPLDQIWIEANYKETQLANVRIGQSVTITSDLWGNQFTYNGKVVGINAGTGNVFSILPAQNATGNWIKIVQRVPVRIELDKEELKKFPLWLGLSMTSTINTHNRKENMLSYVPTVKTTDTYIFNKQLQDVDQVIQQIIQENFSYPQKAD